MVTSPSKDRELSAPNDSEFVALIGAIEEFFAQPIYSGLGPAIEQKKKHMAFLFLIVRKISRVTIANFLLLVIAILFYSKVRKPENKKRIFELAISQNNIRVLERVNHILRASGIDDLSLNGRRLGLLQRFQLLFPIRDVFGAARVLAKDADKNPFIHLQKILGCASLLLFSRLISKDQLDLVCVANDHAPVCMALLHVARSRGSRTCYVQHAPVTEYFPRLNYDISVLFDRASEDAYLTADKKRNLNIPAKVVLLPPFEDAFKGVSIGPKPYRIGICLSFLPRIDGVHGLLSELSGNGLVANILLRRHPRCRLDLSALAAIPKAAVQPKGRSLKNFLEEVDIVLVPNSGVAVEALHYGKVTLFTPEMDNVANDYYGFVRQGIVPEFDFRFLDHPEELVSFFSSAWQKRFSMLDETVTTPLEVSHQEVSKAFRALLEAQQAYGRH